MITSTKTLTESIYSSVKASREYRNHGFVVIAKGNEGTAIIIDAMYPNRREMSYRYGYIRFGSIKPFWIGKCVAYRDLPQFRLAIIQDKIEKVVAAANAVTALRRVA